MSRNNNEQYYDVYSNTGKVCPRCGCPNCQIINETKTTGKDYGVFSGICGYLKLGPVGLLCGLCGADKKIKNKAYWVCPNCGRKFRV